MRIGPDIAPASPVGGPATLAVPAGDGGAAEGLSFGSLLDGQPEQLQAPDGRTWRFAELGMFGRYDATAPGEEARLETPGDAPAPSPTRPLVEIPAADRPGEQLQPSPEPPDDAVQRAVGSVSKARQAVAPQRLVAAARPAEPAAAAPVAASSIELATSDDGAEPRGTAPRRPKPVEARSQDPLRLTLFEEGATIQIAASGALSHEEGIRLRSLGAALLARFGLSLGRFTLNGVADAAQPASGDRNGRRAD